MLRILLLLVLIPLIEINILSRVHHYWSQLWGPSNAWLLTFASLLFAAFVGGSVAKRKGLRLLQEAQEQLRQGTMPSQTMLEGLLTVAGGILLIIPGYVSDVFGILLLIPWTASWAAKSLQRWFAGKVQRGQFSMHVASSGGLHSLRPSSSQVGATVIVVEAIDQPQHLLD